MEKTLERWVDRLPDWARSRPRRRVVTGAVVLVLVLVLAVSCLGGSGGRADVPVLSDGADAGVDGVRSPSTETGGTLRVVAPAIDSVDPQRSYLPGVWNLMRLYTRTLVTYRAEPGRTGELVPDLATDLGTVSEDGLSWTFTLRGGVRFESGDAITSADVKYGIQRSFASDVIVGGPTYVVGLLDDPDNPYPGPYSAEEGDPELAAVETPDESTIIFRLRRPAPEFLNILALPSSSPVPSIADTQGNYESDPVSSGPYAITSVDPALGIVLDRNPEWDPATDSVRTALPDRVVVRTDLTGIARDQALLAGSADADLSGSGVQPQTLARLDEPDSPLVGRVDDVPTRSVRLLALPSSVPPMDQPDCRAAVAAAVDRAALQTSLGGPRNADRIAQLWPHGLPGAPEDPDPAADLRAARGFLAACGRPEGFPTVLAVADVPSGVQTAEQIAAQLGGIGIDVDVRPLPPATFYATDVGSPAAVAAAGYGIILTTWTADFPTPSSFLVPLVDGRAIRAVGNTNIASLADPSVDAAIDAARLAGDAGDGRANWQEVAAAALATGGYVPLAQTRIQLLAGQRLRNGVVMAPYGGYDLATAGVR